MTTETETTLAQSMEAHRQALIDAAIEHEQVIGFIEKLYDILAGLGRTDVVVSTETRLENNGVRVRVMITYDFIFPEQSASDREKNLRKQQAETTLLKTLREEKIKIGTGFSNFPSQETHYVVFRALVSYQGEIQPV